MAHAYNPEKPFPWWSWAGPLVGMMMLSGIAMGVPTSGLALTVVMALLLGLGVFAAVHHAEVIALKVGEPFGSIVLAVAVTVIEVALIVALMLSAPDGAPTMARDAVFASIMIVLGGIVGLSLLAGGMRHREQSVQTRGAASALSVLATLAVLTLILPNYATTEPGPYYTQRELVMVAVLSLVLYGLFLFIQTVRHRDYFLAPDGGDDDDETGEALVTPSLKVTLFAFVLLLVALVTVVVFGKLLSPAIMQGMAAAGLPNAFLGVVVAGIVLLPEGMAAVNAARADRVQTSLNLALGSAIACIGLTVPAVAAVSMILDARLTLGIAADKTVLLALALFVSVMTLVSTGKTTVLHGAVHLVIFCVYLFLSAGLG